jgi:hypothetical protein
MCKALQQSSFVPLKTASYNFDDDDYDENDDEVREYATVHIRVLNE